MPPSGTPKTPAWTPGPYPDYDNLPFRDDNGMVTLSDLHHMRVWPTLPMVDIDHVMHEYAYVCRLVDTPHLFWARQAASMGGNHWVNIQHPDRGTPSVFVPKINFSHRPGDEYLTMPLRPRSGEWVCVGRAIRLNDDPDRMGDYP